MKRLRTFQIWLRIRRDIRDNPIKFKDSSDSFAELDESTALFLYILYNPTEQNTDYVQIFVPVFCRHVHCTLGEVDF
jgi:hypothetical protein